MDNCMILTLRPQKHFGLVTAELKRVASLGQYMMVKGAVRSDWITESDEEQENLRLLATLCEEMELGNLYSRYANRKMFRHARDFWASSDQMVKSHTKRMADMRLQKAVNLADKLDIPILYVPTDKTALHLSDRLRIDNKTIVTPVMNFSRHAEGTTYWLQLRMDDRVVDSLSEHLCFLSTFSHKNTALTFQ